MLQWKYRFVKNRKKKYAANNNRTSLYTSRNSTSGSNVSTREGRGPNCRRIRGYQKVSQNYYCFGSARTQEDNEYYQKARELGAMLAREGYAVVTGGGGGIMEAANRGAKEAGGTSIGFNIILPHEQSLNDYTTDSFAFSHFAPRKIVMTMMADAYVYFPGVFGTVY